MHNVHLKYDGLPAWFTARNQNKVSDYCMSDGSRWMGIMLYKKTYKRTQ